MLLRRLTLPHQCLSATNPGQNVELFCNTSTIMTVVSIDRHFRLQTAFCWAAASKLVFSAEKPCPILIRSISWFMTLVQTSQHHFVLRDHAAQTNKQKKSSDMKAEARGGCFYISDISQKVMVVGRTQQKNVNISVTCHVTSAGCGLMMSSMMLG